MMAPTVVLRDGEVELVLGSAGSNRIRSAILQTIVGVVDHGLDARAAVEAPRAALRGRRRLRRAGHRRRGAARRGPRRSSPSASRNLFFGGVQAVERDRAPAR